MVMGAHVVRMAFAPGFGIRPGFVTAMVGGETCREVETEGLGVGIECPLTLPPLLDAASRRIGSCFLRQLSVAAFKSFLFRHML